MKSTIRVFRGIAPREQAASLSADTYASQAIDVDLSRGICKPAKADTVIEGGHGGPQFAVFRGSLVSGLHCPVKMFSGDKEAMIYRDNLGVWRKRIKNSVTTLGIQRPYSPVVVNISMPAPSAPTIQVLSVTNDGKYLARETEYTYSIVWATESASGGIVEGPKVVKQAPLKNKAEDPAVAYTISRPANKPAAATHWNIYRSDNGKSPQLCASCRATGGGEGNDIFTDNLAWSELGRFMGEFGNDTTENYELGYVVTWDREVEGYADESGPSFPVYISVASRGVMIMRPFGPPPNVVRWNIYRISQGIETTTDYELVARVDISQSSYDDYARNEELGDVIPTSYETNLGLLVQAGPPPVELEGISTAHYGMLFGWKGSEIYYTESGKPDYWSDIYKLEAASEVISIIPTGSMAAVLTKEGVQYLSGTQPLAVSISSIVSPYGAISRMGCTNGPGGAWFICKAGLVAVTTGEGVRLYSEATLGDDYFRDMDLNDSVLQAAYNKIYLGGIGKTIVFDLTRGTITEMTKEYYDIDIDAENGRLLGLLPNGNIVSIGGSCSVMTYTYQTGDIVLGMPQQKRFQSFEFHGEGVLVVEIEMDGQQVASRTLELENMRRHRTIKVPRKFASRSAKIKWSGTGVVREVSMEVEVAPIEVKNR